MSAGLSINHDYLGQRLAGTDAVARNERETTPGAYMQYTYNHSGRVIAMAGLRIDHSSLFGTFVTPRFHLKLVPAEALNLRLSVGKGYRTVHALAENNNLLASGRALVIDDLDQESAWNYGISSSLTIPLFGKNLRINAEYYHTRFCRQAVVDYESLPQQIHITNLDGKSYSNTLQVDANYDIADGLELTAAYRLNDVKTTYGGKLMEKPLTSRYKGLLTVSYKTPLELWQLDATFQLNGGGRMPTPYQMADGSQSWPGRFHAYGQLSAQATRWVRHFSVYIGGENLTNFRQKTTIINASSPWSDTFDPTMVWGPVQGAMFYAGIRINIGKL
jgi:outer membrane receptor protein involved in Fe transport